MSTPTGCDSTSKCMHAMWLARHTHGIYCQPHLRPAALHSEDARERGGHRRPVGGTPGDPCSCSRTLRRVAHGIKLRRLADSCRLHAQPALACQFFLAAKPACPSLSTGSAVLLLLVEGHILVWHLNHPQTIWPQVMVRVVMTWGPQA